MFKKLVPIVVVCQTEAEAQRVNTLNELVFARIKKPNFNALEWAIRNFAQIDQLLPDAVKFHAIRFGHKTGIWVDWDW